MKKNIKILCIIIAILFLLFILNTVKNYFFINNLISTSKEYLKSLNNYYALQEYSTTINSNKFYAKIEQYYKDGVYLDKIYQNNELTNINWINTITGEKHYFDIANSKENFPIDDDNYSILFNLEDLKLSQYFFNLLIFKDNPYYISLGNNTYIYYNKNTKICEKYEVISDLPVTLTYSIKKNCVTDADIKKPEL